MKRRRREGALEPSLAAEARGLIEALGFAYGSLTAAERSLGLPSPTLSPMARGCRLVTVAVLSRLREGLDIRRRELAQADREEAKARARAGARRRMLPIAVRASGPVVEDLEAAGLVEAAARLEAARASGRLARLTREVARAADALDAERQGLEGIGGARLVRVVDSR
ncbi:MAG: hypothetical protein AB7N76_09605 [Planctomycetota bacterium]